MVMVVRADHERGETENVVVERERNKYKVGCDLKCAWYRDEFVPQGPHDLGTNCGNLSDVSNGKGLKR
jgi:hypothetical protein